MSDEILRPFLEGWTLDQVIEAKRLFIVDHDILTGLPCRDGFIVSLTNVYVQNPVKFVQIRQCCM